MGERGVACVNCTHDGSIHAADGHCRLTGCDCAAYMIPLSAEERMAEAMAQRQRRVCIDVPDGYVLSLSLIPDHGGEVIAIDTETTSETEVEVDDGA